MSFLLLFIILTYFIFYFFGSLFIYPTCFGGSLSRVTHLLSVDIQWDKTVVADHYKRENHITEREKAQVIRIEENKTPALDSGGYRGQEAGPEDHREGRGSRRALEHREQHPLGARTDSRGRGTRLSRLHWTSADKDESHTIETRQVNHNLKNKKNVSW